jgi:hypothetical protein
MTDRDFIYWLRGFVEGNKKETLSKDQYLKIKEHLEKVFQVQVIGTTTGPNIPYSC